MRTSRFFIATLKEVPAEAEIASHRLMLRAGLIRRLSAGIYTWLPLGLRVLHKVEAVVRHVQALQGARKRVVVALWSDGSRERKRNQRISTRKWNDDYA